MVKWIKLKPTVAVIDVEGFNLSESSSKFGPNYAKANLIE